MPTFKSLITEAWGEKRTWKLEAVLAEEVDWADRADSAIWQETAGRD